MSEIILPPIPPRPPHQLRPTLTPVPETPGNKGVKVLMVKGPGDNSEPPPPPPPPPTTIGAPTIYINDVESIYGEPIHVPVNTPVNAVVTIAGDASPSYKWEARGSYPLLVGQQAATTTLTFPEEGGATVTMTITDSTATDSPISYAMNFYVASQQEWEILHPSQLNGGNG